MAPNSTMLWCPQMAVRSRSRARWLSLSARVGLLNPKRQEIIKPVFAEPRGFVLLSIRDLAKRLKTDPATMVRIVRGMRFRSYREFQHYLHELSIAHASSLEAMQSAAARRFTIPAQVQASLDQDHKNLNGLAHRFDARRLAALARRLYSARRIVLVGGDLAVSLVRFLEHHLNVLGLPVSSATQAGEIVHKMRHMNPKDVVIGISFHRGLRQTVEGLRQAHAHGAYCVGVTDTLVSPVSQLADECYYASVNTPSFGASYVAPMALFNAFIVACANYRRSATLAIMKKVDEEQRYGFRWFES